MIEIKYSSRADYFWTTRNFFCNKHPLGVWVHAFFIQPQARSFVYRLVGNFRVGFIFARFSQENSREN